MATIVPISKFGLIPPAALVTERRSRSAACYSRKRTLATYRRRPELQGSGRGGLGRRTPWRTSPRTCGSGRGMPPRECACHSALGSQAPGCSCDRVLWRWGSPADENRSASASAKGEQAAAPHRNVFVWNLDRVDQRRGETGETRAADQEGSLVSFRPSIVIAAPRRPLTRRYPRQVAQGLRAPSHGPPTRRLGTQTAKRKSRRLQAA